MKKKAAMRKTVPVMKKRSTTGTTTRAMKKNKVATPKKKKVVKAPAADGRTRESRGYDGRTKDWKRGVDRGRIYAKMIAISKQRRLEAFEDCSRASQLVRI